MKKFFRKLFSPLVITAIVSIIEIAAIVVGFYFLQKYLDGIIEPIIVLVAIRIVEVIAFMIVVNKRENPEYKIPWIILIFLFPIVAIVLYVFFANHGLKRRDKKILKQINTQLDDLFEVGEEEKFQFRETVPLRYRSIFKYLRKVTRLHNACNNRVTYYKNGETFFPELVESLKTAQDFIFMEFFIIGEGKWWSEIEKILIEKAEKGVEVRLIYDSLGCFGVLPNNYANKLRKKGIKCYKFHPFMPFLSGTYNNRDHRKIAIIDHSMAYTGGMNLADEYANDEARFGYWKDTMVKVEGAGISNFIATFLENYDIASHSVSDYKKYVVYDYPEYDEPGYVYMFGDGPGGYSKNEPIGEENYLQIINRADRTLWISTPYLIPTYRLMEALKNAAKRGVDVKLFVPGIPDKKAVYWLAKSNFGELSKAGVHIFLYTPGFNHEKQMVADGILAFCGTINFDFRSLVHHFECGVTMYDTPCIREMVEDFKEMEKVSQRVRIGKDINAFQRLVISILSIFRALL